MHPVCTPSQIGPTSSREDTLHLFFPHNRLEIVFDEWQECQSHHMNHKEGRPITMNCLQELELIKHNSDGAADLTATHLAPNLDISSNTVEALNL